ncbi:MAG TPA: ArsB/NhaD family transporter, partial [Candidatus Omnitrophota bacterium]|nr:ArsB/NhaD family transporter [Candidatus Omnitrophota bacterium]
MASGMVLSIIIFTVVYVLIATEKMEKTIAVILGAAFMLALRLVPFEKAASAVDLNVIFLLVGMMVCMNVLSRTGFFEWLAVSVAKMTKGSPLRIMLLFILITAVVSAFLDNVTTVILMAPVTILIAQLLEISPVPFLILEAISSNAGGAATLIGDPPNILIGSQTGLSFNDFLFNLAPCIVFVMAVLLLVIYVLFRRGWNVPGQIKARVTEALPRLAIVDGKNMRRALIILAGVLLAFVTHTLTGLEPGIIALCGAMIMVLICGGEIDRDLVHIEWGVIFFFVGLFMLVAGLEHNGVIHFLANQIVAVAGTDAFLLSMIILFSSALFSAVLDNIPFVMAMVPLIKEVIVQLPHEAGSAVSINGLTAQPLWWALALGACLGGNGTLIGASANVVISKISA